MTMIINDIKLDFSDVLFVPQRSTWDTPQHRSAVDLTREFRFKHCKNTMTCVPIIAANMDSTGTLEMAAKLSENGILTALHKFYDNKKLFEYFAKDTKERSHTFYSMGISDNDFEKFKESFVYMELSTNLICIDVANGYTEKFVDYVRKVRELVGSSCVIMAGNVVTPDITIELIRAGADIVKVGIGSGSVCTTRKVAGVGYPQFSAILECANAAHGQGGHICSDGGIVQIADFAKAFGAGADFVMAGSMFAGHDECGGEIIYEEDVKAVTEGGKGTLFHVGKGKPTKMKYHGMSSKEAMLEHYGEKASYRAAEGKEVLVDYKGPVSNTIEEILGGIRSTCTYVGARKLKDIPKCAQFIQVNRTHNTIYGE